MPPTSQTQPTSSKHGPPVSSVKDIRSFFGRSDGSAPLPSIAKVSKHSGIPNGSAKNTSEPRKQASGREIIEIDDEGEHPTKAAGSALKRKATVISSDSDDDPPRKGSSSRKKVSPIPKTASSSKAKSTKTTQSISSDEDSSIPKAKTTTARAASSVIKVPQPKPKNAASRPQKRRTEDDDFVADDMEMEENDRSKRTRKTKPAKLETNERPKAKASWIAAKASRLAGPSAPGSKEIPDGEPNCLAGLAFVFTGELSSLAREEAIELAKRFGGRVTGQPSSVTSYVVLGDNAGPAKLAAIKKHGLKTLNEDEFLDLIRTRKTSEVDKKTKAKLEKEEAMVRKKAEEMEKEERKKEKEVAKMKMEIAASPANASTKTVIDPSSQLWTTRYAPASLKDICGNKGQVEKLRTWLHDWSTSFKNGFKKPGKDGMNIFRAVLISGPPGIGKTTSAHLCAKLEGYTPIELNASDARSKRLVENSTNIQNTSLDGWMGGKEATNAAGVHITDKSCLIMDEVDGMSAGDRGGVGALNALIKKTRIPIICICNDRSLQKMKPLVHTTYNMSFRKPEPAAIRSRILSIAFKEKMKIPANVIDQLVQGSQSDIRQVLNMLSTWKLSSSTMDFDEGKHLSKLNEKYSIMTPFTIINKLMGPYLFGPNARETLGDKIELYFHDYSFIPLFVQENYLKFEPAKLRQVTEPKQKQIKQLKLMDKAASSISDADLVDALIHGPEQHWNLMPLHAVTSTILPASLLYGNGGGFQGPNGVSFPQWLGQNSKQGKLARQLSDVQIRMRLRVSGDKPEIRQHYIPSLFPKIVKPLIDVGASAVEDVIETLDDYFLSKEEWDTIVELGLGPNKGEDIQKKISSTTKSTLTRKYNASEHPVAFHKGQDFGKAPKKIANDVAPDLEDVFDLDEEVEEEPDIKAGDDDEDVSKDSLIKAGGGKGKGKGKVAAKPAGKAKTTRK